jgi:GntR family transcriptional regulator
MFFSIEPSNGVAIYEQIVRQVKFAIAEQTLRPGQLLPSVRTLSQQLAINPNTINRAFQQLQSDGVLESIRGKGMAVCKDAPNSCIDARKQIISDRIKSVISEALHAGVEPDDLRLIVNEQISALAGRIDTVSSQTSSPTSLNS